MKLIELPLLCTFVSLRVYLGLIILHVMSSCWSTSMLVIFSNILQLFPWDCSDMYVGTLYLLLQGKSLFFFPPLYHFVLTLL